MVIGVDPTNPKKYKFKVSTLYIGDGYVVKRSQYNDRLYIYVYKARSSLIPSVENVLALRVVVYE